MDTYRRTAPALANALEPLARSRPASAVLAKWAVPVLDRFSDETMSRGIVAVTGRSSVPRSVIRLPPIRLPIAFVRVSPTLPPRERQGAFQFTPRGKRPAGQFSGKPNNFQAARLTGRPPMP